MSISLRKRFRQEPPVKYSRSLRSRVGRLEGSNLRVKELNGSSENFDLSGFETLHSYQTDNVTVGSGPTAIRFTDIAQGDTENSREGNEIRLLRLRGEVELTWIGLEGKDSVQQFNRVKRVQVRMMVVQVFDETSEETEFEIPPTLVDIFQNSTTVQPSIGTFPEGTNAAHESVMGGPYRSLRLPNPEDTAALDRSFLRQRTFKVWYDRMETLEWPSQAIPIYDGASAYEWLGGIKTTNTDMETGGAVVVARHLARKVMVPINVKLGSVVQYLEATTQAIAEVKGNLYFYIFSGHGLNNATNQSAANWPTTNGAAADTTLIVPQVVWRHRFRLWFESS